MADTNLTRVNKEGMQEAINNYKTRREQMMDVCTRMNNAVKTLDDNWDGQASKSFTSRFNEMYNNLRQCDSTMSNLIGRLEGALSTYDSTEVEITAVFERIEIGVAYTTIL